MDFLHRTYRIAIRLRNDSWEARISHVRGRVMPVTAKATTEEGEAVCAERARTALDSYLRYLADDEGEDEGDVG